MTLWVYLCHYQPVNPMYVDNLKDTSWQHWFNIHKGKTKSCFIEHLFTTNHMLTKLVMGSLVYVTYKTKFTCYEVKSLLVPPFRSLCGTVTQLPPVLTNLVCENVRCHRGWVSCVA